VRGAPPAPGTEAHAGKDLYGDPLPPGALARMGTVRLRHHDTVHYLAFSPVGPILASGSYDGALRLWDPRTGRQLRRLDVPNSRGCVAWAPDGKLLAGGFDEEVIGVWEVSTARLVRRLGERAGHGFITALAFGCAGRTLASVTQDKVIRLWDLTTGHQRVRLEGHRRLVGAIAFSPDGVALASSGWDGTIRVWDVRLGRQIRVIDTRPPEAKVEPDDDGYIPQGFTWSPDGKALVCCGADGAFHLWSPDGAKELRRLRVSAQGVGGTPVFSPDGRMIAAGAPGPRLVIWDGTTGKEIRKLPIGASAPASFSADGRTLASAGGYRVRLWDVATGEERLTSPQDPEGTHGVLYSPDGKLLATAGDEALRLWDAGTGRHLFELHPDRRAPARDRDPGRLTRALAFTLNGRELIAASSGRTVGCWHTRTGRQTRTLAWEDSSAYEMALSPDAQTLAVETDLPGDMPKRGHWFQHIIRLCDRATGREIRRLRYETRRLPDKASLDMQTWRAVSSAFSPDGKLLAAATRHCQVHVWETATGRELRQLADHRSPVTSIAFSPDGKILASCEGMVSWTGIRSDHRVHFWEVSSGRELCTADRDAPNDWCNAVVFSPDGRLYASAAAEVQVREVATNRIVLRFPDTWSYSVAFRPDGARLASAMASGGALVWDLAPSGWRSRAGSPRGPAQLEKLWQALAGDDAPAAYRAVWTLGEAKDQTVPFLKSRLRPVTAPAPARLRELIADLDADDFEIRQAASRELSRYASLAQASLREALANAGSAEARSRIEAVLKNAGAWLITDA
jgi:WD40 repeat protein